MSIYLKLKPWLPEFDIELVTLENLKNYENIFYCNREYYLITDGVLLQDKIALKQSNAAKNSRRIGAIALAFH